jgi:hypothetical protein
MTALLLCLNGPLCLNESGQVRLETDPHCQCIGSRHASTSPTRLDNITVTNQGPPMFLAHFVEIGERAIPTKCRRSQWI